MPFGNPTPHSQHTTNKHSQEGLRTMTTYYKLADVGDLTMRGTQWGVGVTHAATGDPAQGLHSDAYIHAYEHPLLAVFHDPIGNNFGSAAHLWEAESDDDEPVREGPISLGVRSLTTLRQIPLPQITTEQRVRYAILCGKAVYTAEEWVTWADNWLSGADRSRNSIDRAVAGIAGARPIALRVLSAPGLAPPPPPPAPPPPPRAPRRRRAPPPPPPPGPGRGGGAMPISTSLP